MTPVVAFLQNADSACRRFLLLYKAFLTFFLSCILFAVYSALLSAEQRAPVTLTLPYCCEPGSAVVCWLPAIEISVPTVRDFSSAAAANSKKTPGVVLPAGDPRALLLRLKPEGLR